MQYVWTNYNLLVPRVSQSRPESTSRIQHGTSTAALIPCKNTLKNPRFGPGFLQIAVDSFPNSIPLSPPPIQDLTSSSLRGTCRNDVTSPFQPRLLLVICTYHPLRGLNIIYIQRLHVIVGFYGDYGICQIYHLSKCHSLSQTAWVKRSKRFAWSTNSPWICPRLDRSGDLLEVFSAEVKPATAAGWFTPRTHLKNMLVKMDSSGPQFSGFSNNPNIWVATTYL